jgi:hypothetical protein
MDLVNHLVETLGITETQAKGGTGLIMRVAQQKLNSGDFNQIANTIPGLNNLIKTAPEITGTEKALRTATGTTGGKVTGNLTTIAGGFTKLGMDTGMITKFIPVVLTYVQSTGGNTTRSILEKVLK